jgi:uncharacterized protein YndB with AHSA1/START domain
MSMDKPFRVEVVVDAPRDAVWRALSEPEQIRHWFGWDYDALEEEIRVIFVEHAKLVPPDRIELSQDGVIELEPLDEHRTVVRVIKPGDAAGWDGVFGDIEEGWITFFNQLRHRFARNPESTRRTILRWGSRAMPELPGEPWHESSFQRGAEVDGELVVVMVKPDGEAMLLVTTYDLDDEAFAAEEARWDAWWEALSDSR